MKNIENRTIKEYIDAGQLEKGQYLYSYILGTLFEYRFMYLDDNFAVLRPMRVKNYEKPKTWERYPYTDERDLVRAEINFDMRFNVNPTECLKDAVTSLENHIKSSIWQKEKAEKLLNC